jgi:hypothetical protein
MNQTYTGRATFQTDVEHLLRQLLVAAGCRVGHRPEEYYALLDTASQWCILPPDVGLQLGYVPTAEGETRLHTRFGALSGELIRLPITLLADAGEPAEVEATWFLSPDWPGPLVIGWKGCLERIRFAFDPHENSLYFAED